MVANGPAGPTNDWFRVFLRLKSKHLLNFFKSTFLVLWSSRQIIGLVSKSPQWCGNLPAWLLPPYPVALPLVTSTLAKQYFSAQRHSRLKAEAEARADRLGAPALAVNPGGALRNTPRQPQNKHVKSRPLQAHFFLKTLTLTLKLSCSTPDDIQLLCALQYLTPSPRTPPVVSTAGPTLPWRSLQL